MPFKFKLLNRLEIFNENCIIAMIAWILILSNLETKIRIDFGWLFHIIIILNFAINMGFAINQGLRNFYQKVFGKVHKNKKKAKLKPKKHHPITNTKFLTNF